MIRRRLVQVALGVVVVAVVGTTLNSMRSGPPPPLPPTSEVTRGVVLATVSATGNVNADDQLAVDFTSGGRITQVLVQEGQRVRRGQPLARLDDAAAREELTSARADLAAARAKLAQLREGATREEQAQNRAGVDEARTAVDKAATELAAAEATRGREAVSFQLDVDQARRAADTVKAGAAQHAKDLQTDVTQATTRVSEDRRRLSDDKSRLDDDRKELDDSRKAEKRAEDRLEKDRDKARKIEDKRREKGCDDATTSSTTKGQTTTTTDQKECHNLADDLTKAQNDVATDEEDLSAARSDTSRLDGNVRQDEADVQADEQKLADDTKALADARGAQEAGRIDDEKKVEEADKSLAEALDAQASGALENEQALARASDGVTGARAALGTKAAEREAKEQPPSPGEVQAQEAEVAGAATKVTTAERTVSETTLVAPADGTVAVIASKVGEHVSGAGAGGGDRAAAAADGPANAQAPGSVSGRSGGFITLTDLGALQVKAGFSEADTARINPGQAANVAFDALSGKVVSARVAAIDTIETVVSNVVTYDVTVLLEGPAVEIKPGMTASIDVVVAEKPGVLRLPASALSPRNGVATVNVLQGGKPVSRSVTTGLKGDDDIEILGGLKEGDRVIVARVGPVAALAGGGGGGG
jgi:HlyD family secretion protein